MPWHLTTTEFLEQIERVLRPGGMYVMNLIDYPPLGFVRAEAATAGRLFEPWRSSAGEHPRRRGRRERRARCECRPLDVAAVTARIETWGEGAETGILADPAEVAAFIGDAVVLSGGFAPVDQLWAADGPPPRSAAVGERSRRTGSL